MAIELTTASLSTLDTIRQLINPFDQNTYSRITSSGNSLIAGGLEHLIESSDTSAIVGGYYNTLSNCGYTFLACNSAGTVTDSSFSNIINGVANNITNSYLVNVEGSTDIRVSDSSKCTVSNTASAGLIGCVSIMAANNSFVDIAICDNTDIRNTQQLQAYGVSNSMVDSCAALNLNLVSTSNFMQSVALSALEVDDVTTLNSFNTKLSAVNNALFSGLSGTINDSNDVIVLGGQNNTVLSASNVTILNGNNCSSNGFNNTYLFGQNLSASMSDAVFTENIINSNSIKTRLLQFDALQLLETTEAPINSATPVGWMQLKGPNPAINFKIPLYI